MRVYVNRNTSGMNCIKYPIRKSSSSFLRSGGNLPSDAIRYMVCLIQINVDKWEVVGVWLGEGGLNKVTEDAQWLTLGEVRTGPGRINTTG